MGGDRRFDATLGHHHVAAFTTAARKLNPAELPPEADQISLAEIVDPTPERGEIEASGHASNIACTDSAVNIDVILEGKALLPQ